MSDVKHTPGPWIITANCDFWVEPENAPDDGEFHGVAHCGDIDWPNCREKQAEWEANARLIAAAPDLLDALRGLLRSFHPTTHHDMADYKAARAAVAKAEGGK